MAQAVNKYMRILGILQVNAIGVVLMVDAVEKIGNGCDGTVRGPSNHLCVLQ